MGGDFRGRELVYPAGRALRPTTSRTREAVFDVLGAEVRGCVFIDLFAGGGAIGIEALSRGAASCHFVEASREVAGYLRRNIERLALPPDRARVHEMDAGAFLDAGLPASGQIVYADPPYASDAVRITVSHFSQTRYPELRRFVVEHRGELDPADGFLRLDREKRYGDTIVSFFAPEEASA